MNENLFISAEDMEEAGRYWRDVLAAGVEDINLYYDKNKSRGSQKVCFSAPLDSHIAERFYEISKGQDLILYIIMAATIKAFLFRYTGQNNIAVSSPVYSASQEYYEQSKYVILKDSVREDMVFKELLNNVKKTVVEGCKRQFYSLDKLINEMGIGNEQSLHRIIVLYENIHNISCVNDLINSDRNDLTFCISKGSEGLIYKIMYDASAFEESTISHLWSCYENVTAQLVKNVNIRLGEIEMITKEEEKLLLETFNNTAADFPDGKTIHQLFEEQAEKTPDNTAVEIENETITYRELNQKSNQLAALLKSRGVEKGNIVAIMAEYSIELVIGILAILKAGGAYLPIDPKYPEDRISYMLEDSGVKILLMEKAAQAEGGHGAGIPSDGSVSIIDLEQSGYGEQPDKPERSADNSAYNDIAYLIYTSGSTGKPKGVAVEHRSLVNFIYWRNREYGISAEDRILQMISISFDGFGTNFYSSLLSGAALVFPHKSKWGDFNYLCGLIQRKKITHMSIVPLMYKAFLESSDGKDLSTLRLVVLAAENSGSDLVSRSRSLYPDIILVNEYGPTENTIAAAYLMGMKPENTNLAGRPIANNSIYILDRSSRLLPIGAAGELCISGAGLARGYIGRTEQTSERFVQNPFAEGERMYKTGDVAKWRPDGNIQLLGRLDNQVKIRGYRVEPEEVEQAILSTGIIKHIAVAAKEEPSGGKYLCGYVTAADGAKISELRESLGRSLPEYMIPTRFTKLEHIPLLPNGKINRHALPEPDSFIGAETPYIRPQNTTEAKLAEIWSSVLGAERVGINDNFFEIGGNSLLLMQVYSRIDKLFPGKVSMPDLFSNPTVSKLAVFIDKGQSQPIVQSDFNFPVLPEEYMSDDSASMAYNDFALEITGSMLEQIQKICQKAKIEPHDFLLTIYICLIAKISRQNEVTVLALTEDRPGIVPFDINLERLSDFSDIFTLVSQIRHNSESNTFELNFFETAIKNETSVVPLYHIKDMPASGAELTESFDIVLEADVNAAALSLVWQYNPKRLRDEKMEEMISRYMKLAEFCCSQYT